MSRLELLNKLCATAKIKRASKTREFLTKREIIHLVAFVEAKKNGEEKTNSI